MTQSSLIVLNPAAHGGDATRLWGMVEPEVAKYSDPVVVHTDPSGYWVDAVHRARADGVRVFIAAGGDGTVNALVNTLLGARDDPAGTSMTLGAIGLGSSNDFHKPVRHRIGSVPLRVDPRHTRSRDVGLVHYRDGNGCLRRRCFLVSASLGLTAEANGVFNGTGRTLRWLKRVSTSSAIAYAAVRTIVKKPTLRAELQIGRDASTRRWVRLTNLNVMKTPFLSGWMRFDTPVEPDDGCFAINLCHDMSRLEVLAVLRDLSRGRFLACQRAGTHHFRAAQLRVRTPHPVSLELDGEVVLATEVTFELAPQQLRCCT